MRYECVVIGASLGGLHAVSVLLSHLPGDFSVPIAVAQHRAAVRDNDLATIWQRSTTLSVHDAEDKASIEPNHVYVAPADYHLLVESRDLFALSRARRYSGPGRRLTCCSRAPRRPTAKE